MSKKKKTETKNQSTNCPKNQSQDHATDHSASDCGKKNSCGKNEAE